jgi:glycosyltransferase involved in cell wall biosynthesis
MKSVLERYGVTVPMTVIPTGVDSARFPRRPDPDTGEGCPEAQELERRVCRLIPELQSYPRRLLFVGRVAGEKNVQFLFELHRRLRESYPGMATLLVGDGPDRPALQEKAAALGWALDFLLPGYRPPADVSVLYRTSTVFVFPSKTETQGLVTIEAMLSGLPVVAIGRMGTREVMNGDNGGYMTDDDLDEFERRVRTLLDDSDLWRRKSAEAYRHGQRWTVGRSVDRMEQFYQKRLHANTA